MGTMFVAVVAYVAGIFTMMAFREWLQGAEAKKRAQIAREEDND